MEEKKKSNVFKYILVFIIGLVLGAGCLFGYNKFLVKDVSDESVKEVEKDGSNENDNENDKSDEVKSDYVYTLKDEKVVYKISGNSSSGFLTSIDGNNMKKCTITILSAGASPVVPFEFDVPLKSIVVSGYGQGRTDKWNIFFLLQDGTIRYLNIDEFLKYRELQNGYSDLPTPKKLDGLDNVEDIFQVVGTYNDPAVTGGLNETMALKKDGSFVLLYKYMGAY